MADLQEELQRFLTARFGVDVKDAFVSCIQKIHKEKAAKQAGDKADVLSQTLETSPLVADYRQKMQDASDLLQYVTQRLEDRINEELGNGK